MKKSRLLGAVCTCVSRNYSISYIVLLIMLCMPSFAAAQAYLFTDLATLGGTINQAFTINNSGQIAGTSWTTGDTSSHATVWDGATVTDLTPGISGWSSVAEGINTSGQVAGQSVVTLGSSTWAWRASVWNGTTLTVLDTLQGTVHSDAWDINDAGQVAGRSIN